MIKNKLRYLIGILHHGGRNAEKSRQIGDTRSTLTIVTEMAWLYLRHGITVKDYLKKEIGIKKDEERASIINELHDKNKWVVEYDENWQFLAKYSGLEWQYSHQKRKKRDKAYINRYHMGKHCILQYGVTFISEHHHVGEIKIGDYVLFARNVDIDITGDITIEDGVAFSEGAKVLCHAHDTYHTKDDSELIPYSNRAYVTPLVIGKNTRIGAHAIIMPGVTSIGENSFISAGAVVTKSVPDRVVVAGNPAQVVAKIPKYVLVENRVKSDNNKNN